MLMAQGWRWPTGNCSNCRSDDGDDDERTLHNGFGPIDWKNDPCAAAKALREVYYRLIAGRPQRQFVVSRGPTEFPDRPTFHAASPGTALRWLFGVEKCAASQGRSPRRRAKSQRRGPVKRPPQYCRRRGAFADADRGPVLNRPLLLSSDKRPDHLCRFAGTVADGRGKDRGLAPGCHSFLANRYGE